MQSKVEGLTTTNALMKEDLAIARNSLMALQAENLALRRNGQNGARPSNENVNNVLDHIDPEMVEALAAEKKKRLDLERELDLQVLVTSLLLVAVETRCDNFSLLIQVSLKAETDMAMKLLEKDIHEKQDTIISLRRQLEDIKQINLEMYNKLQVCKKPYTCVMYFSCTYHLFIRFVISDIYSVIPDLSWILFIDIDIIDKYF